MRCSSAEWILEDWVPWDDAIVVSVCKLRKLWHSLSEVRRSLCERRLDSSEACATAYKNCTVYAVFPSGMMSHSKIAQFNWECIGRLIGRWKHLISKCQTFKISKITVSFVKRRQGRSGLVGEGANNIAYCGHIFITALPDRAMDLILYTDKRPGQLITLQ